jgi:transposase
MDELSLYSSVLGLKAPWTVEWVKLDKRLGRVDVLVVCAEDAALRCPECRKPRKRHDARRRSWRHLDTCQYQTLVTAEIPRVRCPLHGVLQLPVPWAEPNSRFTALFETLVIAWLREASTSAVARRMKLSWDQVDGIMTRAVRRGLARRSLRGLRRLGVDEVSSKRGHRYLTIVSDHDSDRVVHVAIGRKKSALTSFYAKLTPAQRRAIRVVTMDMWEAYISATREFVPDADRKIAFDKFHIAKYLGDAVDKVRRAENKELVADGDRSLVGTKWTWLRNLADMPEKVAATFDLLRHRALKVARAWIHKEIAMGLWWKRDRDQIREAWQRWCRGAARSRLQPLVKVQAMIRSHLQGIINAIEHQVSNARAEGINSRIQWVKRMARGYRNTERFRNAIYFHLGKLDLSPL